METPLVTVIIPCRRIDKMTMECLKACREMDYPNFEVVLVPDLPATVEGANVVPTGPVTPGEKRNIAASIGKGEILAYIDSDAYPKSDWLSKAVGYLQEDGVGAVGGPGLTPPGDGAFAAVQDSMLSSHLVGGLANRYKESRLVETDDIHSVNFIAWREVVERAGGWDEHYWPGEDTLLCLNIKKAGFKQLLAPDVVVYHHRRPTLKGYLQQIANYGTHRGFFAKRFPDTSRRLQYFAPTFLVLGLGFLVALCFVNPLFLLVLLVGLSVYAIPILLLCLRNDGGLAPVILIGVPLTHLVYGLSFARGLLTQRLAR